MATSKEEFYTKQRQTAEANGDNATLSKIRSKMNLGDKVRAAAKDTFTPGNILTGLAPEAKGIGPAGKAAIGVGRKIFPKAAEAVEGAATKAKDALGGLGKKFFPEGADAIKNPRLRNAIKAQNAAPKRGIPEQSQSQYSRAGSRPSTRTSSAKGSKIAAKDKYDRSRGRGGYVDGINEKAASTRRANPTPLVTRGKTTIKETQGKATSGSKVSNKAKDSYVGARIGKASQKAETQLAQSDFAKELSRQSRPPKTPSVPRSKGPSKPKQFRRDGSKKDS